MSGHPGPRKGRMLAMLEGSRILCGAGLRARVTRRRRQDTAPLNDDVALTDPWPAFWAHLDGEADLDDVRQEEFKVAADMLRVALFSILRAAGHQPERCLVLLGRLCGMTYAEIGEWCCISRQAAHKQVRDLIGRMTPVGMAIAPTKKPRR